MYKAPRGKRVEHFWKVQVDLAFLNYGMYGNRIRNVWSVEKFSENEESLYFVKLSVSGGSYVSVI